MSAYWTWSRRSSSGDEEAESSSEEAERRGRSSKSAGRHDLLEKITRNITSSSSFRKKLGKKLSPSEIESRNRARLLQKKLGLDFGTASFGTNIKPASREEEVLNFLTGKPEERKNIRFPIRVADWIRNEGGAVDEFSYRGLMRNTKFPNFSICSFHMFTILRYNWRIFDVTNIVGMSKWGSYLKGTHIDTRSPADKNAPQSRFSSWRRARPVFVSAGVCIDLNILISGRSHVVEVRSMD